MSRWNQDFGLHFSRVNDPEIGKPITKLGMVKSVTMRPGASVEIEIYLTTAHCPLRSEIVQRVTGAVADIPEISVVRVHLDVMDDEQRANLRRSLRGDSTDPVIPFSQPDSTTRVYAIASGKGDVGKSTITVRRCYSRGSVE